MSEGGIEIVEIGMAPAAIPIIRNTAAGPDQVAWTGRCRLMGYNISFSGANGQLNIYDGQDTTGRLILNLLYSTQDIPPANFGPGGIRIQTGLYVNLLSSVDTWTLFVIPEN